MKKILIAPLLLLVCHAVYAADAAKSVSYSKPKLVVGIVVDQMRADFIYKYWSKYGNGGFKRLVKQGFFFKDAHYNYVPTVTGPGHASIFTGATPALHGIIANNWFDKVNHKSLYCTEDNQVHAIGGLEKFGQMSPKNMLTTTIGDQLRLSNHNQSKVIGIALKDRGAILAAGHLANAAYWLDPSTGYWMSSSYYMAQLPEWVNAFNHKELAKTYLAQQWQTLLPIAEYTESMSDKNNFEGVFKGETSPVFPHNLPKIMQAKTAESFELIKTTPFGNSLTKDFAVQTIMAEKLGKHSAIDMLTVSFSATDYVGHQFAPHSVEVEDTYLRLDKDLAEFLTFLDSWLGKEQVLVFLTGDHGAMESPAYLASLRIPTGRIEGKELGETIKSFFLNKYGNDLLKNYSNQQIFLDHDKVNSMKLSITEVTDAIADYLLSVDCVAGAVTRTALNNTSFDTGINHFIQSGYHPKRSGDVVLSYAPGCIDSGKSTGTTHGSAYGYDNHVPLLWYGWRISEGQTLQNVEITDIAATLALLLDIQAPNGSFGKFLPLSIKN